MADFSSELALMIGLGVGIDYALFIVTRYREAYATTAATSQARGRAARWTPPAARCCSPAHRRDRAARHVRCSASSFLYGVAIAASLGVLLDARRLAHAAARAARVRLGDARRPRRARRAAAAAPQARLAAAAAGPAGSGVDASAARGAAAIVAGRAVMLALAAPALGAAPRLQRRRQRPAEQTTHKAYELLAQGFGQGFNGPLLVAVQLPAAGDTGAARAGSRRRSPHTPGVASVAPPRLNPAGDVATIAVYPTLLAAEPRRPRRSSSACASDVVPPLAQRDRRDGLRRRRHRGAVDFATRARPEAAAVHRRRRAARRRCCCSSSSARC